MRPLWFVPLIALCACQSQTMERDQMGVWKTRDQIRSDEARREAARDQEASQREAAKAAKVITIPAEVAKAHADFIARKSTIFADAVEIDLTREPWFGQATFAVSRDAVIRRDEEDAARGILTITLQRIPNVAPTMESVPTVHFGDGLRVVGVDRVVLRFWSQKSAERPMWFHAVGAGKSAVYKVETDPPQEWRGKSVDVRSEIHLVREEYRFDSSAEAKP
jgi:hypothetical protein